jgi:POT family proton-dependent oligopeptide transporter
LCKYWLFYRFCIGTYGNFYSLSFRDLDRREAELNAIGQGPRAGFVDESPTATIWA